jgi:hypothetical protein
VLCVVQITVVECGPRKKDIRGSAACASCMRLCVPHDPRKKPPWTPRHADSVLLHAVGFQLMQNRPTLMSVDLLRLWYLWSSV